MTKKEQIIEDLGHCLAKIHNKLGRLEKRAANLGTGERLFASELHTIEAIGKRRGNTVGALSNEFGITKGGVSQIVSKLEAKNCVRKERNVTGREVYLFLTEKGRTVFRLHQTLHKKMDKELFRFLKGASEDQLYAFSGMLVHIEQYVDRFLEK